jgi:rubrerythrin
MAIVSGYTITKEQYEALADLMTERLTLRVSAWPDHSITIDDGDSIVIEFVEEGFANEREWECPNCGKLFYADIPESVIAWCPHCGTEIFPG